MFYGAAVLSSVVCRVLFISVCLSVLENHELVAGLVAV